MTLRSRTSLKTASRTSFRKKAENDEEEEHWEPYVPEEPSPILYGMHSNESGKFWLSMGGFDAGYLYECGFKTEEEKEAIYDKSSVYNPIQSLPMTVNNDVPITVIKYSKDKKRIIMGFEDGSVNIYPLDGETSKDLSTINAFWRLNIHDNNYGNIRQVATSFDDQFLFTIGEDGNFFTFQMMGDEEMVEKVKEAKAKIPSAKKDEAEEKGADIDDPAFYSIEDAKQKSEYDKMMQMAEEKKTNVRMTIDELRTQFQALLEKNKELPQHLQLKRKEFEMDPEILKELERQKKEKISLVKREMAWEEEKHRIALEKIRSRFKDDVECERIVVKSFLSKHEVSTFRTSKLPADFYQTKLDLESRKTVLSKVGDSRQPTDVKDGLKSQEVEDVAQLEKQGTSDEKEKGKSLLHGATAERVAKSLAKVEEKKRKRAARRAEWAELNASKPDDDYEDPADIAAIHEAQENMGDYKLKSADDYVVPDNLRMNAEKARLRLMKLKELIHNHKYNFNEKLVKLRDKKIDIISVIKDLVDQLVKVQGNLDESEHKPVPEVPVLHPDEIPEKKFVFTREELIAWDGEKKKKELEAKIAAENAAMASQSATQQPTKRLNIRQGYTASGEEESLEALRSEQDQESEPTEMELKIRKMEKIRNTYEQSRLIRTIEEMLQNFDAELRVLRHEKFKQDIDLKMADLRHVTLFEELTLLKEFEKHENVLTDKVDEKTNDKTDMQLKIQDIQQKLENKKKDIEKQQEKEKALHATFITSLGENNKFVDYLTKVFKKKIKRSKKKQTEGEGSDEESDEESSDESDWSESEEESDSEGGGYDLDICPPGCDQNLYDNTCQLREKRLDIEELLTEEKKTKEALSKELETLQKKEKIIDSALKSAVNELEAFQLEKQRKINELDVVVPLKFHQIQYTVSGILPADLQQCLIFEAHGVNRLMQRIKELEQEKSLQKKQKKEARKKHIQLIKDKRAFESHISQMGEQVETLMLQKFGRLVDLEKLETVTVNRNIEELKEKLIQIESASSEEVQAIEEKIEAAKDEITNLIRQNTKRLDQYNMLMEEKTRYGTELDHRQKNLGTEFSGLRGADIHERQRLIQLVHLQAQEVEGLKDEIMLLSRKGGHILPPAQPPVPRSAPPTLNKHPSLPNIK